MTIKKLNNRGVGTIEIILLVVVVAAVTAIGAYVLGQSHAQQPVASTSKSNNGGGKKVPNTGTCSVTPTTVAVGQDFTVNASGLPANTIVNVWLEDSVGTQWTSGTTSATGTLSNIPEHASYAGTNTITINTGTRQNTALATCSINVS